MKKNCYNCECSEYVEAEAHDPSGWVCYKFDDYDREEKMLSNMSRESYREKAKRCCELKEQQ